MRTVKVFSNVKIEKPLEVIFQESRNKDSMAVQSHAAIACKSLWHTKEEKRKFKNPELFKNPCVDIETWGAFRFVIFSDPFLILKAIDFRSQQIVLIDLQDYPEDVIHDFLERFHEKTHKKGSKTKLYTIMILPADYTGFGQDLYSMVDAPLRPPVHHQAVFNALKAARRILRLEKNLYRERARNNLIDLDLKNAMAVQKSLLPKPGVSYHPKVNIAHRFIPHGKIGGDIYNITRLDENNILIYLADASGHGISASLMSVMMHQHINSMLHKVYPGKNSDQQVLQKPAKVANMLDRYFDKELEDGKFFTIIYGVLDLKNMEYKYVSAGQPDIVLITGKKKEKLFDASGKPLGLYMSTRYQQKKIKLNRGDRFYIYSDGIIEAGKGKKLFGMENLRRTLRNSSAKTLEESLDTLIDRIKRWSSPEPCADDISIIGVEIV